MKILFGRVFGIGNAVMCIPALKALRELYPTATIDVLLGTGPDDFGAKDVLLNVVVNLKLNLLYDTAIRKYRYDIAIMSIPFDGRWKNGIHFDADEVLDGRTRPDPSTTGLISWKKHESEYQLDTIRALGWQAWNRQHSPELCVSPTTEFLDPNLWPLSKNQVYLGLGYKKDEAGFWARKHWGNENYAELINRILAFTDLDVITTGNTDDLMYSQYPIKQLACSPRFRATAYPSHTSSAMRRSFEAVATSRLYVGNDTGMMHVAASCGVPTLGLFFMENSIVKSRPLGPNAHVIDAVGRELHVDEVMDRINGLLAR